jgi:hypothetical protein
VTIAATPLPPIPSFTTLTWPPSFLCSVRDMTFDQRSLPLSEEKVPSVIESPKAQTTSVSAGAVTSSSLTKKKDVVE